MKTKNLVAAIVLFLILFGAAEIKAQFKLHNGLTSCKVVVTYEMWDPNCDVCSYATVSIPAGSTLTLNNCNFWDICIVVVAVDGISITWYNHANSDGNCHFLGITGQSSTGECSGGWNTSITSGPAGTWSIF